MGFMQNLFNWYHDNGIASNIWKGATGQLSQEQINSENIGYQRERNEIEDARYAEETAYNRAWSENERAYQRQRDSIADARYNEETAFNRDWALNERNYQRAFSSEEQAYNRAFAEDERAYQRAFSSEEQAYNRAFAEDERAYQRAFAQDEKTYQRDWALNERDYQRSLQQQIFDREDTAIARQAEALRAQGINPLSQSMNGLGAGSVVSAPSAATSSPGSSRYSPSSSGSSSGALSSRGSPTSPGSSNPTGGSSVASPVLSTRQGKALQKAMITSQGINGLLGPILQTMNTVDSLRGSGIQRDVLNANAMKAQAEANIAVMNMFDTANRLNIPEFKFKYGVGNSKEYKAQYNGYNPYFYSPQEVHFYETNPKRTQSLISSKQADSIDAISDATRFLTSKLKNIKGLENNDKELDSFASVVESLILKAFK